MHRYLLLALLALTGCYGTSVVPSHHRNQDEQADTDDTGTEPGDTAAPDTADSGDTNDDTDDSVADDTAPPEYDDLDHDGYPVDVDCDDNDRYVYPGATEYCNGYDEDCDGTADNDAVDAPIFYADRDGDGYGDPETATQSCTQPSGYVVNNEDCDDYSRRINPAATEYVGDDIDNDCDGETDETDTVEPDDTAEPEPDPDPDPDTGIEPDPDPEPEPDPVDTAEPEPEPDPEPVVIDDDGDGYEDGEDCDDSDASINPGATEICGNGIDEDCSGADQACPVWYADDDGDGYGDSASSTSSATMPSGYVANSEDCDDDDASINPGATEIGDFVDNDCDGTIDPGLVIVADFSDLDWSVCIAPTVHGITDWASHWFSSSNADGDGRIDDTNCLQQLVSSDTLYVSEVYLTSATGVYLNGLRPSSGWLVESSSNHIDEIYLDGEFLTIGASASVADCYWPASGANMWCPL